MSRSVSLLFSFFFVALLSFSAFAQSGEKTIQEKIDALIKFHGMETIAYAKAAGNYYYGLGGFPEDKQEAYFWWNICLYESEKQMSMQDSFRYMEEAVEEAGRQFGKENITGTHMMGKMLLEPGVRQGCADFVDYINKYVPQLNTKAVQSRIAEWKKTHPNTVPKRTPEQKKQFELNHRFLNAISTNAQLDPIGIQALVDAGADLSMKTLERPRSVLAVIVAKKNADVLAILLKAHKFEKDEMQAALKSAYLDADWKMADILVSHGAVPDEGLYIFALQGAMQQNDFERVDYFLKQGTRVEHGAFDGRGPAGTLIAKGYNQMLARYLSLLEIPEKLPRHTDNREGHINNLFAAAGEQGNIEAMQILLKAGADINAHTIGGNALLKAIAAKQDKVVDFLIKQGASFEGGHRKKERLMENAFYAKNQDTIDILVKAGIPLTPEQQKLLAQCKFRKKTCPGSITLYVGPPKCDEDVCRFHSMDKDKLEKIVDHPTNAVNASAVDVLRSGNGPDVERVMDDIMREPGKYSPATLRALSERLFARYRDDEGIFWYMAADIRATGDRAVCKTVKPNYRGDRQVGISHVFDFLKRRRMEYVLETAKKVVEWDSRTPYDYNFQWGFWETSCLPLEEQAKKRQEIRGYYAPPHMPSALPVEEAWNNKMEDMLEKAQKGDVDAQARLGECYASIHRCHRPLQELMSMYDFQAEQEKERERTRPSSYLVKSKDFVESDAMNARKWLQKAADGGHPHAARMLANVKLFNPFTPEEKAEAYAAALEKFKRGEPHAIRGLVQYSPPSEGDKQIIEYAFLRVMAKVEQKDKTPAADRIYQNLSAEQRVLADKKAEDYIEKYYPLYGSIPVKKDNGG